MPRRSTNPVGTLAKASMGVITRLEKRNRELVAALNTVRRYIEGDLLDGAVVRVGRRDIGLGRYLDEVLHNT